MWSSKFPTIRPAAALPRSSLDVFFAAGKAEMLGFFGVLKYEITYYKVGPPTN